MTSKQEFLRRCGFADWEVKTMAGDASIKSFYRLTRGDGAGGGGGESYVLMQMPFDDDTYTAEAGLAKSCLPFLAVGEWLRTCGIVVPKVVAKDVAAGFILLEDLGSTPYTKQHLPLGVELLNHLHTTTPAALLPYEERAPYALPAFTTKIFQRESALFLEWFLPANNITLDEEAKQDFLRFWQESWQIIEATGQKILLRDYHSPNFLLLPHASSFHQLAVLDYQDALVGSPLYDVVSLTQDARIDISADEEARVLATYNHSFDDAAFALLGAQRALKIIGIFQRFAHQGKPAYLRHLPRVFGYLQRNLTHPALTEMKTWLTRAGGAAAAGAGI